MITQHSAIVGLPGDGSSESPPAEYPAIERHTVVDLLHITRIEQIDASSQPHS